MNRMPLLFAGLFLTFALAWLGLVLAPWAQFGHLDQIKNPDEANADLTLEMVPPVPPGLAMAGERVYAANGCVYCHTQQVRRPGVGGDIARGWGTRQSMPRDYIFRHTVFLGSMRTGPDLANVGAREPAYTAAWFHKHLYSPRSVVGWSTMPSYSYLYTQRRIQGERSADALDLEPGLAAPEGYEIVPTEEARALVAYLMSLKQNYPLPEAPEASK